MITPFTPSACRVARSNMLDGIAGRLDIRARLDVQDHVATCGACARELADLVAGTNASRRALERYRVLRARVAPGRARLFAYRAAHRDLLARLLAATRRLQPMVGVAVVMLVIISAGPASDPATGSRLPTRHYTRAADDPAGLIGVSSISDGRIPVFDGVFIDERSLPPQSGAVDRPRTGPQ